MFVPPELSTLLCRLRCLNEGDLAWHGGGRRGVCIVVWLACCHELKVSVGLVSQVGVTTLRQLCHCTLWCSLFWNTVGREVTQQVYKEASLLGLWIFPSFSRPSSEDLTEGICSAPSSTTALLLILKATWKTVMLTVAILLIIVSGSTVKVIGFYFIYEAWYTMKVYCRLEVPSQPYGEVKLKLTNQFMGRWCHQNICLTFWATA